MTKETAPTILIVTTATAAVCIIIVVVVFPWTKRGCMHLIKAHLWYISKLPT